MAKATKGKRQGGKVQKVITIVKARGVPDEVKVERSSETRSAKPKASRTQAKLPRQDIRISPKMPRLE